MTAFVLGALFGAALVLVGFSAREWGALSGNPEPTVEHDPDEHLDEWQRARRGPR